MIFKKTYSDLMADAIKQLTENTSITNVSIGSVARSLLEIINDELSTYYETLELNTAMGFLSSSEGYFLDLIGELLNTSRLSEEFASSASTDNNVKFYVLAGYLSDVLPDNQIPAGTLISTTDGSITYSVSADTLFSAGVATEVYVSVTASTAGANSNVGKNKLIVHDLGINSLYVTNVEAIITGSDTEDDDNYRFRISKAVTAAEKANETSIRLAALSVAGVADVEVIKYARGLGSFDLIVIPLEGLASDTLIASVQTAVDGAEAYGIKGTVIRPDVISVNIELSLSFTSSITDKERVTLRESVRQALENYIVNIPIGGSFIYNKFVDVVMNVSPHIINFEVNCYYFRGVPHLRTDVPSLYGELFYPDPNRNDPIRIL